MSITLPDTDEDLVRIGERMDGKGWVPATAGNLSYRAGQNEIAITSSGKHKGRLTVDDIMRVTLDGAALTEGKSSAETLLHCHLYKRFEPVQAVLHGHSVAATILSMQTNAIEFYGFEIQKAFGASTHESELVVPVFDNDQDIAALAKRVDEYLPIDAPGYILRGHGVYVWGKSIEHAYHRLEALEFLLLCRLEQLKLGAS